MLQLMEFQLLISLNPSMYLKLLASFSLLNGVKNIKGTSKTFLEVQVAKLKNRIFLACSTNISLVDGTSIWQFFQSWSEIRRGFSFDSIATSISTPPVLECWFPRNIDCPILIPKEKLSLQQLGCCTTSATESFSLLKGNHRQVKSKGNS